MLKTIKDIDVQNKTVLLRADLNVPKQNGKVTDTSRIDRLKPTIDYLKAQKARILILSHFGRPEGEQNPEMSLAFLIPVLSECWDVNVQFANDCIGPAAEKIAGDLPFGEVALLENVRFHGGETDNSDGFT